MADFITRLTERTLGIASVVQPLIASTFAPEQTTQLTGLAWDDEMPASSDYPEPAKPPPTVESSLRDAPKRLPGDTVTIPNEKQGISVPITRTVPPGTSDFPPNLRRTAGSPLFEREVVSGQEGQSTLLTPQN